MKITWLGQAGLLFETCGKTVIVDPYLSDSVARINPNNKRRVPTDERFLELKPDFLVLTHAHLDHTDPDTLCHYLGEDTSVCVLASQNAWDIARKYGGIKNNYVRFTRHTEWTEAGIHFAAVRAEHSDEGAIGVIIEAEGKRYYITGDTLYNTEILEDVEKWGRIDYVFLPVNGCGNNMNFEDGARFCKRIGAVAVPMHCGLFDSIDMNEFPYEPKVVPEFYSEILL